MKKFFSFFILVSLIGTVILPVSALSPLPSSSSTDSIPQITYPTWDDFAKLKTLIDTNFSPKSMERYGYNCIANGTLCPNYRYTSVIEKAIMFIVLKTYTGNESFYDQLLPMGSNFNMYVNDVQKSQNIKSILDRVPKWPSISDWKTLWFGSSIWGQLLDASFGVNFVENTNSNDMITAIEQKIKDLKRQKCQKENSGNDSSTLCPWSWEISNRYLPTPEELYQETIYLNRGSVKIESLKDEFEYVITWGKPALDIQAMNALLSYSIKIDRKFVNKYYKDSLSWDISGATADEIKRYFPDGIVDINKLDRVRFWIQNILLDITTITDLWSVPSRKEVDKALYAIGTSKNILSMPIVSAVDNVMNSLRAYQDESSGTYTLNYKKNTYTLAEAKAELEKKQQIDLTIPVFSSSNSSWKLPCQSSSNYSDRSECAAALTNVRDITIALWVYFSDYEKYPDSINQLNNSYLPVKWTLELFKKNFTYKNTGSGATPDYEIQYIGHIGENTVPGNTSEKKDYTALLSGATIPEIPAIFAHVPADSMMLYVKNPVNLIDILNQKSNTSNRISGIDVSESIKTFLLTFFELKDFEQLQKNLKHEMVIVVNNLDATAPDMVVILSEADKDALSPTAKARVVGSKDGYIFIANSKKSLEWLTNLAIEKSMKNAPDFHYVWWKKSKQIQDAFMFVGDTFFEKMLTFETYLTHYRKYRDYKNLWSLQELTWAYSDAFGKSPKSLDEIDQLGFSTLTGSVMSQFSIQNDGLVVNKSIGSLKWVKTIPEVQYDLSQISRAEIEDYKYNVLKYRDIWRASLDPMGIVLNRYWDGMEIDFFMTPIPATEDKDIQEIQKILDWATKDSLSFITNPHIQTGILSFVFWFDLKKLQEKIQANKELWVWFDEFSKEVLGGKNILDYLGWEFAWTLGGIDPDIFDGWNVEKINTYISVQVTSEEKWKELIDILRNKILENFRWSSEANLIKWFLAKPLIEDYNWKKIYYAEDLPIPYIGKIGFAYAFIDDFFILGINRSTIRHVIDAATTWDTKKKQLAPTDSFEKGTFFATMLDWVEMSKQLKWLFEKNTTSVSRYARYLNKTDTSGNSLFGVYYISQDRNHRLWKVTEPFTYDIWSLSFHGDAGKLTVRIDEGKLTSLSGTTLHMWKDIKTAWDFPKEIMSWSGIPLEQFLWLANIEDIISLNVLVQLDAAFDGDESLLRNTTFGLSLGDNEIGFKLRIFRNVGSAKSAASNEIYIYIALGMITLIIIVGITLLVKRWTISQNINTEVSPGTATNNDSTNIPGISDPQTMDVQDAEIIPPLPISPISSPTVLQGENIEPTIDTLPWANSTLAWSGK